MTPVAGADVEKVKREVEEVVGIDCSNAILTSAKQGIGIEDVLEAVVKRIPPPPDNTRKPLRALIFDSYYDAYKAMPSLPCSEDPPPQLGVTFVINFYHGASTCRWNHCDAERECELMRPGVCWSDDPVCLQGVIVYFRVVDGELKPGDTIRLINTAKEYVVDEVGVLSPKQIPVQLQLP